MTRWVGYAIRGAVAGTAAFYLLLAAWNDEALTARAFLASLIVTYFAADVVFAAVMQARERERRDALNDLMILDRKLDGIASEMQRQDGPTKLDVGDLGREVRQAEERLAAAIERLGRRVQ